jgi:hypothetical protein
MHLKILEEFLGWEFMCRVRVWVIEEGGNFVFETGFSVVGSIRLSEVWALPTVLVLMSTFFCSSRHLSSYRT